MKPSAALPNSPQIPRVEIISQAEAPQQQVKLCTVGGSA